MLGSFHPKQVAGLRRNEWQFLPESAPVSQTDPDYRTSCGDTRLNPFLSFIDWRMEYHIEHHMFAAIPCHNLQSFSRFGADQLPPQMRVLARLLYLHRLCQEKYGSYQAWRDEFGYYKGL